MTNPEHLAILKQGIKRWNLGRKESYQLTAETKSKAQMNVLLILARTATLPLP